MWWILSLCVFFIIGAFIGSFLNVVIDRLPAGEGVIVGRSHCDYCNHTLAWYELIPVISFLVQRGKTCCCGKKMSIQYVISEILTGLITMFVMWSFWVQSNTTLLTVAIAMLFAYSLFVISMIDIKYGIINESVLYFLLLVFVFWQVYLFVVSADKNEWIFELTVRVLSALAASSFFAILHFGTKGKGMGGGDVQLAFVIGLFLSALGTLVGMYLSFMIGGLIAVVFLLIGKRKIGQTIPFGPYMATGALIAFLWADIIISGYLTLSIAI